MRSFQRIFCGLLPVVSLAVVGCGNSSTTENLGTGQARIVLASQGSSATTMHVTATDDATANVVLDKSVDLAVGKSSVLAVSLDAATYTIHVDATETGDSTKVIGSGDAHADLAADQTKEIHLTATESSGGTGSVSVSVDTAPVIKGIKVTLATDGTSTGAAGQAQITVDASDPDGGSVMFFWSGLGLDGAVKGTSTMSISALAAASFTGPPIVHVVVQDSAGATTAADISFAGSASCVLCGTTTTAMGSSTDGSASASACLDARAQCNATCDATLAADPTGITANLACLSSCGLDLASCSAN